MEPKDNVPKYTFNRNTGFEFLHRGKSPGTKAQQGFTTHRK